MKTPVVDYREFRLRKLNDPRFSHLKYLLGWVGYFVLYFLTETFIPAENCYPVHSVLDDLLPFHEAFVIPYVFWYLLIVISLVYFALYNTDSFKKLQTYIIVTQVLAMTVYILFPTRQDLRPTVFPRDNFLTDIVRFLYYFDTNTGVCPSLHVAYSLGIASVWVREKGVSIFWKIFVVVAVLLICLSTAMIKQHSVVDALAALPVCLIAELVAYGKTYLAKLKKGENPSPSY